MTMNIGDLLPTRTLAIRPEPMHVVARVLRDPNPIHLDPKAAAAAGLGERVINQGPSNVAYVMDMLLAAFPGYRLRSFDCRFLSSVRGGDTVEAGGKITAIEGDTVSCEAWLKVEGAGLAIGAVATLAKR